MSHPLHITSVVRGDESRLVNSMSDLFHEKVTDEMLDKAFAVMALTPQHTYQILTKCPDRMRDYMNDPETRMRIADVMISITCDQKRDYIRISRASTEVLYDGEDLPNHVAVWPLPNVWLDVSVGEDVENAKS